MSTPPSAVDLVAAAEQADRDLARWVSERLKPLTSLPSITRLTVQAGGGKITVKREPNLMRDER